MQVRATSQVLHRCAGRGAAAALMQRRPNSFIKQVMEQVKKDMEKDPKMKKDWEKVQKSSKRMAERSSTLEGRFSELGENLKSATTKTTEALSSLKETTKGSVASMTSRVSEATESNESLKKAREALKTGVDVGAQGSGTAMSKGKEAFVNVMDKSSSFMDFMTDADKKGEKTKKWAKAQASAAQMAAAAAGEAEEAQMKAQAAQAPGEEAAKAEGAAAAEGATKEEVKQPAPEPEMALVVSEARSSSWERFGAGLSGMPFLSSVFENPLFDRMFGESEIAASIREMKESDYTFTLEEFWEDIEFIVAPHIIKNFLEGDQDQLKKHCGDAAFASVDASIKARLQQKLFLDPAILAGPRDLELVSAKLNADGPPSFIFTFTMQQINCLTEEGGEIIEGAVDDIRNVCYAMAVNRHPDVDKILELEYPWQISELAILWNQKCF